MIKSTSITYGDAMVTHKVAIEGDELIFEDYELKIKLSLLYDLIKALKVLEEIANGNLTED